MSERRVSINEIECANHLEGVSCSPPDMYIQSTQTVLQIQLIQFNRLID